MQLVADNTDKELATKKPTIQVFDMIMGEGKTTALAHSMRRWWNDYKYDQVIYLAPNLSEVGGIAKGQNGEPDVEHSGRIREACPEIDFTNPKSKGRGKADNARDLVRNGSNISATHQLFRNIMPDDLALVSQRKSLLVIDEALEVVSPYDDISRSDLEMLISNGYIALDQNNKASFVRELGDDSVFTPVKELCDSGHLYITPAKEMMIWEFPPEVLNAFDDVIISTYLFEGSLMSAWLDYNDYEFGYANQTDPKNRKLLEIATKERIKDLLTIVNSKKANAIGEGTLSQSWWRTSTPAKRKAVQKAAANVVKNILKGVSASDMLVTCPKDQWKRGGAQGQGYSRASWLASNTRATNDYADKTAILYLLDKHLNPMVDRYIKHRGGKIDADAYALGEMLQFLWRGCIRKGEPMTVYIPSSRMRKLLMDWLDIPLGEQF